MILNRDQEIKHYQDKIEEFKKELETRFQNPTCNAHRVKIKQLKLRLKRMTAAIEFLAK